MESTRLCTVALTLATFACSSTTGPADTMDDAPPGADMTTPFPIDRGDDGTNTPGTYKGLWLRLADSGAPQVTPVDGLIGIVCVGMSNSRQECDAFLAGVAGPWAGQVSPAVRVVNCAVGGHAIERWNDPAFDPVLWDDCVAHKVPDAGLRADQVRVIHHKAAMQFTTTRGGGVAPAYPDPDSDYAAFITQLDLFTSRVRSRFPSVQAVYTSSRGYGGYTINPGRSEPLSYEEGHALNTWLRDHAAVDGIWFGWGAYLWSLPCDVGTTNASGICYDREDYKTDGVHPSPTGEAKIALAMHERLLREAWYRR